MSIYGNRRQDRDDARPTVAYSFLQTEIHLFYLSATFASFKCLDEGRSWTGMPPHKCTSPHIKDTHGAFVSRGEYGAQNTVDVPHQYYDFHHTFRMNFVQHYAHHRKIYPNPMATAIAHGHKLSSWGWRSLSRKNTSHRARDNQSGHLPDTQQIQQSPDRLTKACRCHNYIHDIWLDRQTSNWIEASIGLRGSHLSAHLCHKFNAKMRRRGTLPT